MVPTPPEKNIQRLFPGARLQAEANGTEKVWMIPNQELEAYLQTMQVVLHHMAHPDEPTVPLEEFLKQHGLDE